MENYNGFIKKQLGRYKIINWVNFIHFIKSESVRWLNKLINNENPFILNENNSDDKTIITNKKVIIPLGSNIIAKNLDSFENLFKNMKINSLDNNKCNNNEILNKLYGIVNIGFTCYINASIQLLLHNKIFAKVFMEKMSLENINPFYSSSAIYKIYKHIENLPNTVKDPLDISNFIYLLTNIQILFYLFNMILKNF